MKDIARNFFFHWFKQQQQQHKDKGGGEKNTSGDYFEPIAVVDRQAGLIAAKVTGRIGIWIVQVAQVLDPRHLRPGFQLIFQYCSCCFLFIFSPPSLTTSFQQSPEAGSRNKKERKYRIASLKEKRKKKYKMTEW